MNIVKMKALGAKEVNIKSSFPILAEGRLVAGVQAIVYKGNLIIEISCHETNEPDSRIIKYRTSFDIMEASEFGKDIVDKDYYEMGVRGDDFKIGMTLTVPSHHYDFSAYTLPLEARLSYGIGYSYLNIPDDSCGFMVVGSNGNRFMSYIKEESSGRYIMREIGSGRLSKYTLDIWWKNTKYNGDFLIIDKQGNVYYVDLAYGDHKTISIEEAPAYNGKIFFDKGYMKVYCKYIDVTSWVEEVGDEVKVWVYEPKKVDRNNHTNIFKRDGIVLLEEIK